jgi:sigma-E factor negative regulatory protein RseC
MESATGKVSSVGDGVATVVVDAPVACARCAAGKGCGAGLLAGEPKARQVEVRIPSGMTLEYGDSVTLGIAPRYLLRAAMLAYGLPLIGLLAFCGIAWTSGVVGNDLAAVPYALAGLYAGILAGRRLLANAAACEQFTPVIDGHVPAGRG